MRILLLGAGGFLGRYLFAALASRGHDVVPAVRDPRSVAGLALTSPPMRVDLNRDTDAQAWRTRLAGIDAVINCAGILQGTPRDRMEAIHTAAPRALFAACEKAGVLRVIQVSAVSAEPGAGTAYAETKRAADDALRATTLEWVVLRPSLVYAPGARGGTAFFRAIAALPGFVPLPGRGDQPFQPIAIEDLCAVVVRAVETPDYVRQTLDPVGPDVLPLREILGDLRRWLGFGPARFVPVPLALIRAFARLGAVLGGPFNSTAIRQLEHGNTSDYQAFRRTSGLTPRRWAEALRASPSQLQDRWHARLHFVRPLLRAGLGVLWLVSAGVGLLTLAPWAQALARATTLDYGQASALLTVACFLDLALGALLLARWRPWTLAALQVAAIAAYTAMLTVLQPGLWADPLGPLLKNVAIVPAVLALAALEDDR